MKIFRKIILVALLISLLCGTMAQAANIDTGKNCSLTIYDLYGESKTPVNNMVFTVSKVASVSYQGVYTLTDTYSSFGVTNTEINTINHASDVSGIIEKLLTITDTDATAAVTDGDGKLVINGLSVGLYLVTASDLETDTDIYSVSSSLVVIPGWENNAWQYDIVVYPKIEKTVISEETEADLPSAYSSDTETEDNSYKTDISAEISTENVAESKTSDSVQTSDDMPIGRVAALLLAAIFIYIGSWKYHRHYRE